MKHWEYHPSPLGDCFGCKALSVGFASVPGGTRPGSQKLTFQRKFDKGMHAYREARRAGEQPDGTTVEAVERTRRRQEVHERADKILEG